MALRETAIFFGWSGHGPSRSVTVDYPPPVKQLEASCVLKVQEILHHGTHPFRFFVKRLSRCLSLLWQLTLGELRSREIMSMEHLEHFVEHLRSEGFREGEWGEVGVVEMYPNFQKFITSIAVEFF